MKKILLLSDTHSHIDEQLIKHIKLVDEVWHAGDIGKIEVTDQIKSLKPLRAVYGNIDNQKIRTEFKEHLYFTVENVKVYITHIGGYPPRYNKISLPNINNFKPNLFISGHSHILKVCRDQKRDILHMNPGAIGKHGFHKVRTMLRFNINGSSIENLELIEYAK